MVAEVSGTVQRNAIHGIQDIPGDTQDIHHEDTQDTITNNNKKHTTDSINTTAPTAETAAVVTALKAVKDGRFATVATIPPIRIYSVQVV